VSQTDKEGEPHSTCKHDVNTCTTGVNKGGWVSSNDPVRVTGKAKIEIIRGHMDFVYARPSVIDKVLYSGLKKPLD